MNKCTHPQNDATITDLPEGIMEIGMGQHGEGGGGQEALVSADDTAEKMVGLLMRKLQSQAGDRVLLYINGVGGTTHMEMNIVFRRAYQVLEAAGVKVIPVVASVALAKRMERCGADAVVAEGTEAGGHIGENTTMVLVPQVADAVQIPVIAAGGIADGRGVAAVFMLGAKGVQLGTRFVATEEAQVHENYKNCILKARDIDSRVTGRSTGHPVRALRNQMTKTYLQKEQEGAAFEELELLTLGGLKKVVVDGDVQNGSVMAGQIAGMIKEKMSCKEVIEKLVQETDALLGGTEIYE
jgi:NAD(P)H-dependent flavin oxidoreductase YrpB (nitropropane dioxygenase family)